MMYSFVEEILSYCYNNSVKLETKKTRKNFLCKIIPCLRKKKIQRRIGSLKRFEPYLIAQGVIKSSPEWNFLLQSEKVRNCILHANRNLNLSKDKNLFKQLLQGKPDFFKEEMNKLILLPKYLEEVNNSIVNVLNKIYVQS